MVMLMSPVQRRGTLSLLVLPCTELLAHAWAPNAPRHVLLMRSDTATGESDQSATASSVAPLAHAAVFGIEAVAGASRETLAFVSRVAEDAVAGHGAVQVADRIAAINGVKITGTSYSTLSAGCEERGKRSGDAVQCDWLLRRCSVWKRVYSSRKTATVRLRHV